MNRGKQSVGGIEFSSKKELKSYIQEVLKRYSPGQVLCDSDFRFCMALLERHPESGEKIGAGVQTIRVDIHKPWTTKGFTIVRADSSESDFSFNACISEKSMTQRQLLDKAARHSIRPQIREFKIAGSVGGYAVCAVSGKKIKVESCDVDHYPIPFADLLDMYFKISGLNPEKIGIASESVTCKFADTRIDKDFAQWHKENARLRIVESSINQSLGRHKVAA